VLVRGRFIVGNTVADIARGLGVPQMPLYRRIEKLLERLRELLERAGVGREDVAECIEHDDP
jgi:DNA-directed RNA polymerase specialized sigma subunit